MHTVKNTAIRISHLKAASSSLLTAFLVLILFTLNTFSPIP